MSKTKVGIVGTGFIASGLISMLLTVESDFILTKVLTRRNVEQCGAIPRGFLTNSIERFIDSVELVIECSGDVLHATSVVNMAMIAVLPVVTMNTEFHVTTGSYFVDKGVITEAEGDQPGCLASLSRNAIEMGFNPVVYGNIKGFLNHNPTREDMLFWSKKSGISLPQVTSFTDGTKVQMEQTLVANGLNASIVKSGLVGLKAVDDKDIKSLAKYAKKGNPISDYILSNNYPAGVFIVATHNQEQREYLKYYKMGNGPYYILLHNFHLCHLEILKTARRVVKRGKILLNNSTNPTISVAAVAKKDFSIGEHIGNAVGSFKFRGVAVKKEDEPKHVPIGLLVNATIVRPISCGQIVTFSDVELPDSLALDIWHKINFQEN